MGRSRSSLCKRQGDVLILPRVVPAIRTVLTTGSFFMYLSPRNCAKVLKRLLYKALRKNVGGPPSSFPSFTACFLINFVAIFTKSRLSSEFNFRHRLSLIFIACCELRQCHGKFRSDISFMWQSIEYWNEVAQASHALSMNYLYIITARYWPSFYFLRFCVILLVIGYNRWCRISVPSKKYFFRLVSNGVDASQINPTSFALLSFSMIGGEPSRVSDEICSEPDEVYDNDM